MSSVGRWLSLVRIIRVFVVREISEQYAGTLLGAGWAFLQPLLFILIYWWVFGVVWASKVPASGPGGTEQPFIVFLLSGFLPWLAFQDALSKSSNAVLQRAVILRQGPFPVMVFPVAKCLTSHLVFLLLLVVYLSMTSAPWLGWIGVAVLYGIQLAFAVGGGLLLSALTVYAQDLSHLLGMGLSLLMFTSPIFYPLSQVPEGMRRAIWINPYTPFAEGYHALIMGQSWPPLSVWGYSAGLALTAMVVGLGVFRWLRPGFADVV